MALAVYFFLYLGGPFVLLSEACDTMHAEARRQRGLSDYQAIVNGLDAKSAAERFGEQAGEWQNWQARRRRARATHEALMHLPNLSEICHDDARNI
jgi:hypothetical protein